MSIIAFAVLAIVLTLSVEILILAVLAPALCIADHAHDLRVERGERKERDPWFVRMRGWVENYHEDIYRQLRRRRVQMRLAKRKLERLIAKRRRQIEAEKHAR